MQDSSEKIQGFDQVNSLVEQHFGIDVQDIRDGVLMIDGEEFDLDEEDIYDTFVLVLDAPVKRSGVIYSENDEGVWLSRFYGLMTAGMPVKVSTVSDVEEFISSFEVGNPFSWLK